MSTRNKQRISTLENKVFDSGSLSRWDISAIDNPLELKVWEAKYDAYCRASIRQNGSKLVVCYNEDVLSNLESNGVEFPTQDILENERWMNEIYLSAFSKAKPLNNKRASHPVFIGVVAAGL